MTFESQSTMLYYTFPGIEKTRVGGSDLRKKRFPGLGWPWKLESVCLERAMVIGGHGTNWEQVRCIL